MSKELSAEQLEAALSWVFGDGQDDETLADFRARWVNPPEPPRVVGQAWRDAEGNTVVMESVELLSGYRVSRSGGGWAEWHHLAHPLTPLYLVPDPDDDEAVWKFIDSHEPNLPHNKDVRAVLRTLREGQG
jgi:FMN phosphatase YigB (HAD superfamily)